MLIHNPAPQVLLGLLRDTDNDDLPTVMATFIGVFGADMAPFALQLAQEMVAAFMRLASTADDSEEESHKLMTAANLIEALKDLVELYALHSPENQEPFDQAAVPIINLVLTEGMHEFLEEVLMLMAALTQTVVTDTLWPALPLLYQAFTTHSVDYVQELLLPLYYFITNGKARFEQDPAALELLLQFCPRILDLSSDPDNQWHVIKLIQLTISHFSPLIAPAYHSILLGSACGLLIKPERLEESYLEMVCLAMVNQSFYYLPEQVWHCTSAHTWVPRHASCHVTRLAMSRVLPCYVSALACTPSDCVCVFSFVSPASYCRHWPS